MWVSERTNEGNKFGIKSVKIEKLNKTWPLPPVVFNLAIEKSVSEK